MQIKYQMTLLILRMKSVMHDASAREKNTENPFLLQTPLHHPVLCTYMRVKLHTIVIQMRKYMI